MMTFTFRPTKTSGYGPRLSNAGVAAAFAQGKETGHSKHMFISGATVFSYGTHFPIARRFRSVILWNPARYSNTTSAHQGQVSYALHRAGAVLVEVDACDPDRVVEQWKTNEENIAKALKKIERARVERWREIRMHELDDLKRQQNYLIPLVADRAVVIEEQLKGVKEKAAQADKWQGEVEYYKARELDLETELEEIKETKAVKDAVVVTEESTVERRVVA